MCVCVWGGVFLSTLCGVCGCLVTCRVANAPESWQPLGTASTAECVPSCHECAEQGSLESGVRPVLVLPTNGVPGCRSQTLLAVRQMAAIFYAAALQQQHWNAWAANTAPVHTGSLTRPPGVAGWFQSRPLWSVRLFCQGQTMVKQPGPALIWFAPGPVRWCQCLAPIR